MISRRESQRYRIYTCDKTIIRATSIQPTEFLNKTSTKIVQPYLYR